MKHVLVISDNVVLYETLRSIIEERNPTDVYFEYRHSPQYSKIHEHPSFQNNDSSIIVRDQYNWIINNFQLIISIHCKQFFPPELVKQVRCINIHPGYNPINRGWFPQVFSIIHDLPIGATIHEMDEKLDNGPIIARTYVNKDLWDTSLSLYNKVIEAEMLLFREHFDNIINGDYQTIIPEKEGNFFNKKDFNSLLELDLNEVATFKSFYDKLRALSHGEYRNAYFIDPDSGKKITLTLEVDYEEE